jgi:hypothetical protein
MEIGTASIVGVACHGKRLILRPNADFSHLADSPKNRKISKNIAFSKKFFF